MFNVNDNNSYNKAGNLESNAYAGAAGGLVSGSGASSEITVDGSATAEVTNATLTLAEDALVLSKVNGSLTGNGAGLAAAGGAAVGSGEDQQHLRNHRTNHQNNHHSSKKRYRSGRL